MRGPRIINGPMRRRRLLFGAALAVLAVLFLASGASAGLLAGDQPVVTPPVTSNPPTVQIIVQKSDHSGQAESLVESLGGVVTRDLSIINAFSADIRADCVAELAASPCVRFVTPDGPVVSTARKVSSGRSVSSTGGPKSWSSELEKYFTSTQSALPSNVPPNTYLDTLGVTRLDGTTDGRGIGVAVIDTGISTDNDFGGGTLAVQETFDRLVVTVEDTYGHGTHVAGIIAGNGSDSGGFFRGIAPGVTLIGLKISDEIARASESDVVAAMQWVYENKDAYNIRVVNLSINSSAQQSYLESPLDAAAEILWFNGVVVVASAGNVDPESGASIIGSAPGNDPFIITVGASDENGTASRSDDVMAGYSAAGETGDGFRKPDIIAPGTSIYSVLSRTSYWGYVYPERTAFERQYFRLSGSSMAAPMVTGTVALILQNEPTLNPDQVKYRLLNSTQSTLCASKCGLVIPYLDAYEAVHGHTTAPANVGIPTSMLLWTGESPVVWDGVMWNKVMWNKVMWNKVMWNKVMWNGVMWNGVMWNSTFWD